MGLFKKVVARKILRNFTFIKKIDKLPRSIVITDFITTDQFLPTLAGSTAKPRRHGAKRRPDSRLAHRN